MIKRLTLLLAMLFAVGSFSTSVFAQEEAESGAESTETTSETTGGTAGGTAGDPECD